MKAATHASTEENLVEGSIHWSSKAQVRGNFEEITHLGGNPFVGRRNRERRPIYIHRILPDDSLLVMTCTTRHGLGWHNVPEECQDLFLPIEPKIKLDTKQPIVKLQEDPDKVFNGISLIFLEVPIIAFKRYFLGYIGRITETSHADVERAIALVQAKRCLKFKDPPITAIAAVYAAYKAGCLEPSVREAYRALWVQKVVWTKSEDGETIQPDPETEPPYCKFILDAPKDTRHCPTGIGTDSDSSRENDKKCTGLEAGLCCVKVNPKWMTAGDQHGTIISSEPTGWYCGLDTITEDAAIPDAAASAAVKGKKRKCRHRKWKRRSLKRN